MLLNAKTNQFVFLFPPNFFHEEIQKRYKGYYKQLLLPYDNVDEFISSTIQSIHFPGWEISGPHQTRMYGADQEFKGAKQIKDIITKEFTIKFKLTEGFVNYFLMLDNALRYLDFKNKTQYFDTMLLGLMNNEGFLFSSMKYHKVIMKNMSQFDLSFSDVTDSFNTFEAKFAYNDWDIDVHFEEMHRIG